MAPAAVGTAVVYFLFCCCSHCFFGVNVRTLLCFAVLCVLYGFVVISQRELLALLLLCSECHVAVIIL